MLSRDQIAQICESFYLLVSFSLADKHESLFLVDSKPQRLRRFLVAIRNIESAIDSSECLIRAYFDLGYSFRGVGWGNDNRSALSASAIQSNFTRGVKSSRKAFTLILIVKCLDLN